MKQVLQIAARELGQYLRTRGFVISLLLVPAWILLLALLRHGPEGPGGPRAYALVDATGRYAAAFDRPLADGIVRVEPPAALLPALSAKDPQAIRGVLLGGRLTPVPMLLAIVPRDFSAAAPTLELWSDGPPDPILAALLQARAEQALRAESIAAAPLDAATAEARRGPPVAIRAVDAATPATAVRAAALRRVLPALVALLTLLAALTIAGQLLIAVVEEKSSRVIELLLAATTARRLMAGKLLGGAGAALTLTAAWLACGFVAGALLVPGPAAIFWSTAGQPGTLAEMPAVLLCAVTGLALYAAVFLGVGAMARNLAEAQSYLGPLLFLLLGPTAMAPALLRAPHGMLATLLSLSPLHAPFILMLRLPYLEPSAGTIATFAWMLASAAAVIALMAAGFAQAILPGEAAIGIAGQLARLLRRGRRAAEREGVR
ncbi:MAG: ABC transporter permease [Dongiaceae bacterium]